jgi:hypothetical protein
MSPRFEGGTRKCVGPAAAYRQVYAETGCRFFDAGETITSSNVDDVHHKTLERRFR